MTKKVALIVLILLTLASCASSCFPQEKTCCPPGITIYDPDKCFMTGKDNNCPSGWNEWFE